MKHFIVTQALTLALCSFGAAYQHHKIQLTDDPTATVMNMAMSPNGSYAAYILKTQIPEKKAQKLRMKQYHENEWTSGFRVRRFPPSEKTDKKLFTGPPIYTTQVMFTGLADEQQEGLKDSGFPEISKPTCIPKTLTFSRNGNVLAIGSDPDASSGASRHVHIYSISRNIISTVKAKVHTDISTQQLWNIISSPTPVSSDVYAGGGVDIALSHDGTSMLSTDHCRVSDGHIETVSHIDLETQHPTTFYAGSNVVGRCAFSPDNSLATAQIGNTVRVWDLRDHAKPVKSFDLSRHAAHSLTPDCLCISPDNSTVCTSTKQAAGVWVVTMLDLKYQKTSQEFSLHSETDSIQTSFAGEGFEVLIPLLRTLKAHRALLGETACTHACSSDDGKTLLTVQDGLLYSVKASNAKVETEETAAASH